jgi:sec-independent protein translocase protein TatB
MFDFAWSELAVIGVVALVVIGPKDLPKALRTAGTMVRKARRMARDFQTSFDDMVRQAELDDLRETIRDLSPGNLRQNLEKAVDPAGEIKSAVTPDPLEPGTPPSVPSTPNTATNAPPAP